MKRVANILDNDKNKGIDFIVHVKNEEQLNDLISVLIERQFEIQPPIIEETLADWMRDVAKEEEYDTCFRLRNREDDRCVAYNPSIEHWRLFCNDILEIINNELEFNEGEYSIEDAKIEAKKLYREFTEDKTILKLFDYDVNLSNDEIKDKIGLILKYDKDKKLKKYGIIIRLGSQKNSYWEIVDKALQE